MIFRDQSKNYFHLTPKIGPLCVCVCMCVGGGNCLIVLLQGCYRSITWVLCMIFLQFIGFSLNKHSIDICNVNTLPVGKCSLGAQIS